jgi:hypothetical protein
MGTTIVDSDTKQQRYLCVCVYLYIYIYTHTQMLLLDHMLHFTRNLSNRPIYSSGRCITHAFLLCFILILLLILILKSKSN